MTFFHTRRIDSRRDFQGTKRHRKSTRSDGLRSLPPTHYVSGYCGLSLQEAVKRLEFEMQRLELQQQLEDMRERMAREKKTRQQDVAHEQWVTEQKRNLQAIKIEKVLHEYCL